MLYIAVFHIHGLIKEHPEIGRDIDTGGQVTYVLEVAKQISKLDRVKQVVIFTRKVGGGLGLMTDLDCHRVLYDSSVLHDLRSLVELR